ncbi:class A beta-lactamase [Amnibacterium soli]|uniref:Class A beta-lactamase n=1 Tax=Amnibacterium soli TaxID=1282736 RepID=A0ABP8YUI6_9MICO
MRASHRLRSAALAVLVLAALSGCSTAGPMPPAVTARASAAPTAAVDAQAAFRELEARYGARLGVLALDTGSDRRVEHRADERFPFASANKLFIAAAVLQRSSDAELDEVVRYSPADLLAHAPITRRHVEQGMTVRALIDAALRYSDNTAANLLVARLGGPPAVQRFLRSLGDRTTSVDRIEPQLNSAVPGDDRDTTTPQAYGADLEQVLMGSALPEPRRRLLEGLLRRSTTGAPYIRAGVPEGWTVADRTGSGAHGVRNDIALVRPPGRAPIVMVLLSERRAPDAVSDDALLADATRVLVRALG